MLEVTWSPTRISARKINYHKKLTSVIYRGVVFEVCVAFDVGIAIPICVDSTCAAPTDV